MITFDKVTKDYPDGSNAIREISFEVKDGEFVSLVGQTGSGKSTILKLITAEIQPSSGVVKFLDRDTATLSKKELAIHRSRVGNVFQDFKLLAKKTAFENIAYALEACGAPEEEINENVPELLEIVGLEKKMNKFPHELSRGEQQKVAIARALIHKPIIIVADEPTGNLDPASSLEIVDLLLKINELGTTVILASHDKDIVNKACKRVIVLNDGNLVSDHQNCKYKI